MVIITEQWVREKVGLQHNQLHNVRSLFLPGSHEHKVSYLGASLQNFCRLKNLDLSCNTLASLEGLHTLQCLEKLNLYYNRLPDLTELFRLRHNQKLIEVDLRLNPVASHDPQYRLFLVRLLPALERLDDMAVMPSERAASASVFTTDQLEQFGLPSPQPSAKPGEVTGDTVVLPDLATDILKGLLLDDSPGRMSGSWRHTTAAVTDELSSQCTEPDLRYFARNTHDGTPDNSSPQTAHATGPSDRLYRSSMNITRSPATPPQGRSPHVTTELLSEAARAIVPLVEEYRKPGMLLSFQFQERVIRVLEVMVVRPLVDGLVATIDLLKEDVTEADAKVTSLEQERDSAARNLAQRDREVELIIDGKANGPNAPSSDLMCRLRAHVSGLCDEIEKLQQELLAEQMREKVPDPALWDQTERLKREVAEKEASLDHSNTRIAHLEASLAKAQEPQPSAESRPDVDHLVNMLRESHNSLIAANKEATDALEHERAKHRAELEQLKWNYAELKRTADLLIS